MWKKPVVRNLFTAKAQRNAKGLFVKKRKQLFLFANLCESLRLCGKKILQAQRRSHTFAEVSQNTKTPNHRAPKFTAMSLAGSDGVPKSVVA
jgi:hypothetical protein